MRSGAGAAAQVARSLQERLQHFHFARGCVHGEARARAVAGRARASRHRRRETDLAREPEVLVDATDAAAAGNHLRQHGHEEAGRPAVEVRRGAAGSDIQTNPPATNEAVEKSGLTFKRTVDQMPPADVLAEIDAKVDVQKMEDSLMREGVAKFADPQKALLKLHRARSVTIR